SAAVEAAQRGLFVGALCGGGRCVMSGAGRPRALLLRRPFGQPRTAFPAAGPQQLAAAVDLFLRPRLARPLGAPVGLCRPWALLLRRPFGQPRTAFLAAVLHQLAEAVDLFLRRRLARPLGGTVGLGRTCVLRRAAGER